MTRLEAFSGAAAPAIAAGVAASNDTGTRRGRQEDPELRRLIKEMTDAQADISRAHIRLERARRQHVGYLDSMRNERC